MLTISQLAEYAGTTVRAIRHYHRIGLLAEPPRDASGYRTYGAQAVVDLKRIRVLADAGVPLKKVGELIHASPDQLRTAIDDIDRDLRARVRELQATRKALAALALDEPFLPPELLAVHEEIRRRAADAGVSPRTLEMEREGWILASTLYPDLMERWVGTQLRFMADPEYIELYLLTDQAYEWAADDPRIEELAQRTAAFVRRSGSVDYEDEASLHTDDRAYALVTSYRLDESPGWERLTRRMRELLLDQESDSPA